MLAQLPLDAGKKLRESARTLKGEMKSEERLDLKLKFKQRVIMKRGSIWTAFVAG